MSISELNQLKNDLQGANHNDDELFHSLINRTMKLLDFEDKDLAKVFEMNRSSVSRWRNGSNAPHPAMRKYVYLVLARQVAFELDHLVYQSFDKK